MKIYTRTGDLGQTGLLFGPRVGKDDPRIEAYGTVDELNAVLGLVRGEGLGVDHDAVLARIQSELFTVGAELAMADPRRRKGEVIGANHVSGMEHDIDRIEKHLPPLKRFILPGGTRASALLHVARTVCRRAERRVVSLAALPSPSVSPHVLAYLNRLSDLLFVMARAANALAGKSDVIWEPSPPRQSQES